MQLQTWTKDIGVAFLRFCPLWGATCSIEHWLLENHQHPGLGAVSTGFWADAPLWPLPRAVNWGQLDDCDDHLKNVVFHLDRDPRCKAGSPQDGNTSSHFYLLFLFHLHKSQSICPMLIRKNLFEKFFDLDKNKQYHGEFLCIVSISVGIALIGYFTADT